MCIVLELEMTIQAQSFLNNGGLNATSAINYNIQVSVIQSCIHTQKFIET